MFPRLAQFKDVAAFRRRLAELGLEIPVDDRARSAAEGSPLSEPVEIGNLRIGNRWCIHPMEGWDGTRDGHPSAHTIRRWRNFGLSGAKLIWGGEAAALQHDGRANPNQLLATSEHRAGLSELLRSLRASHSEAFGNCDDLVVGLQLTHSGRFSRPNSKRLEPRIAWHHPWLDRKYGIDPADESLVWTDDELEHLIDRYVSAAAMAHQIGFQFVDIKACHGYLLHEMLGARDRPGKFGGDLAGRTRMLREIVGRVRVEVPDLAIGVRLSVFDSIPFEQGEETGRPMQMDAAGPFRCGFGVDASNPCEMDLTEPLELLVQLRALGVRLFNITAGSPYGNPHLQRPATFPPTDGYQPPEDPLVAVSRHIQATRIVKAALPDSLIVGTGYSYLQEFLAPVAQAVVRNGWADMIGLGRMVLSYPELPADVLAGRTPARKRICRTFSDCTSGPRLGLRSGCFPLDPYYKSLPEAEALKSLKRDRSEEMHRGDTEAGLL